MPTRIGRLGRRNVSYVGLAPSTIAVIVVHSLRNGHNNIIVIYDKYLHNIIGGALLWGENR